MEVGTYAVAVLREAWDAAWPRWAIAALALVLIHLVFRAWFARRKIQDKPLRPRQIGYELLFSTLTLSIGNLIGVAVSLVVRKGYSSIAQTPVDLPTLALIVLQFLGYFFLFDAYFYFLHRLMHTKVLFWVHRYHHHSMTPNPLTAFSFHPIEALLTGGFIPLMVLLFHPHIVSVIVSTTFGVLSSVLVHSGHEIFPRSWYRKDRLSRFWLTPMFHDRHHSTFKYNFGGFTTIWDRLFGTVEPGFETKYEALHDRLDAGRHPRV